MLFRFLPQNNRILSSMAKRIFLWRSSILGKLDYFCLTCVLFPLVRSAQRSFRQLSRKEMLSIQSNNNVFVESNFSLISRGCCTNSTTDSSRTTILFQKSATCIQYTICSNNVWLSYDLKMHILQITIFFKRRAAYTKGCYSQNMVRCLGRISHYAFKKWCGIVRDISYVLTCTMCSSFKKIYCEKGIACARGFIFDIEVD